jgi:pimeloyl-ACP methyl ester carboxylesterase
MRNFLCLFLLLSLLLGGCRFTASPDAITEKRLSLEPCNVAGYIPAECGYLRVPEDRSDPNSRILKLWTVVIRAYGPDPQPDPLFYIVGGPGVYVTDGNIVANARNIMFLNVNARHDLVFLDQRGTNDQHRLTCELPPSGIGAATSQREVNDWMAQCLAGLDGDPRFSITAPAMQDLDDARAALGYDKINLYGISYGAAAAQVYMRMFPEHVRAVVLDHGTALDLPFRYVLPRASQSALDQVFAYCEQDEGCHAAYPHLRGDWEKVLDRLAVGPVTTSYTRPGMDTPATITMEGLAEGLHELMYNGLYSQIPS